MKRGSNQAKPPKVGVAMVSELRRLLDLSLLQATPEEVTAGIREGAELKSANLWILLLAILVCSVGLNVNSTAVIIGAMLISPVMGPIMATGLGVAVNDFELIRRSALNLCFAALASILVSAAYFWLSPLDVEGTELLARTSPTAWDALIAIFGGLAGAVAATRKQEKSNVLPGVAIATALMPPLCTAGYGLATSNWLFLGGAIYLFYINSICIALGTLVICRLLKYPRVSYMDPVAKRRVRRTIVVAVIFSLLPSTFFGYNLVQKTIFEKNARQFIEKEIAAVPEIQVVSKSMDFQKQQIDVFTLGRNLTKEDRARLVGRLEVYGLEKANLSIRGSLDFISAASSTVTPEETRTREIAKLRQLLAEMQSLFPYVKGVAAQGAQIVRSGDTTEETTLIHVDGGGRLTHAERQKLRAWLEARTGNRIRLSTE